MATVNTTGSGNQDKLAWYLDHCTHTVWDTFSADQQRQMIEDDLSAGTSVSLVLAALITTGLAMSLITVLAVVLLS